MVVADACRCCVLFGVVAAVVVCWLVLSVVCVVDVYVRRC